MHETGDTEGVDSEQSPPSPRSDRNLPVELVRHIIADIDSEEDDRLPTLEACSLVCQAWTVICRSHLFGTLTINYSNFTSRLSFLYFAAPHLCEYVRNLYLSWYVEICPTPEWTPECFGRLKNLKALHLVNINGEWTELPTPFALGLTTLLVSPRLVELEIVKWDFGEDAHALLYMLSFCSTSLESLSLRGIHFKRSDVEIHDSSVINLETLSSLRLEHVHHPGLRAAFVTCPNLKSLTAIIHDGEVWTLPSYVSSKLEELNLHVSRFPPIPSFGETVHLSVLKIHMHMLKYAGSTNFLHFNNWIKDCIDRLPFPELLGQLTLRIDSDLRGRNFKYPQPADFEAMSTFLAQLRDSGMLRRISISVSITVLQDTDVADVASDTSEASEVKRLREGFVPILGPGVDIQLVIQRTSATGYEILDWMSLGEEGDRFSR